MTKDVGKWDGAELGREEIQQLIEDGASQKDYIEGCDALIEKLKARIDEINNKAVEFMELGPFEQHEEFRRVKEIYYLSLLPRQKEEA